jgi:hypothetical protein
MIAARAEQIVEIDGLMRPMEITDTEMQDAGGKIGMVVFRRGDGGRERIQSLQ